MKLSAPLFTFLLLPFAVLATPVPEAIPEVSMPPLEEGDPDVSIALLPRDIFKRSTQHCSIINVNHYVNCRTGPGTKYKATNVALKGQKYYFFCYKKGECILGNCTWDLLVWSSGNCWVNGHYTSAACSAAKLGTC